MEPFFAFEPPLLLCSEIPEFTAGQWESTRRVFAAAASCELYQAWKANGDANFQPARVSVATRDEAGKTLWIYATLRDLDIGNAATARNQRTWELGDVFEIFLEPQGEKAYFEFHVTPENQVLECRFPIPRDARATLPVLDEPIIRSWTNVGNEGWEVLVALPLRQLGFSDMGRWKFSFSRYDAGPGREPILSSSSPHSKPNFHCREEWGALVME